ncbi:MAG: dynamin family protein [Campylobacterota bacterium]
MSLANDYFLLYHGITFEQNSDFEPIDSIIDEEIFSVFALIVSATRKDFEYFTPLKSFEKLCNKLNINVPKNINELNHLQHNVIESIYQNKSQENIDILHKSLEHLNSNNILSTENLTKLLSLFDPSELNLKSENKEKNDNKNQVTLSFKEVKSKLEEIIQQIDKNSVSKDIKTSLDECKEYLNTQKFSIGITGVMNAGKSTMLNALMKEEILGSAVVPETANLSIVKYSKEQYAKVYYWNKQEWNKIEHSSNHLESMKKFVEETKAMFGNKLDDLIKEESKYELIDIKDLSSYTSAQESGKKCNLIKYVELGSNLEFLKDGIEIVDTPGLDDPVIQREEITKSYISDCDMMIHLMNVSQSATLKDIEFIIDAVLYQNVSKLLIVITRADTVDKKDLEEVIEYTKSSIQSQLKAQNKGSQLDYILKTINFIPISGKMALLHRTGKSQEALDTGFSIEDTGILEIEEYLYDSLFGADSQKSDLIIQSSKSKLIKTIQKEQETANYELKLLSKSKDELQQEFKEFEKKKSINKRIFTAMQEDINFYKTDIKNYINSLEAFLDTELLDLKNVIKQRVVSDVRYSFEKTKKRPPSSRVKVIIQTAIKDGIIDIIRDYRYKFIKKSQTIGEQCEQKYHDFGFSIGHKNDNFDAIGFFQDDFKSGFLTSNNEILLNLIIQAVSKVKPKKLNEFDREIEEYIKQQFVDIEDSIKTKANKVSNILIDEFFKTLNEPLEQFKEKLKSDENILQKQLESSEQNSENRALLSIDIHKKIKKLNTTLESLKGLN